MTDITLKKNDPKTIHSWAMYDWANSAYNLVITTTIFPAYYKIVTEAGDISNSGSIDFLGFNLKSSSLYNYVLSAAYLVIAFFSPILSSIADSKGNKKVWMKFFTYTGATACCLLFFFTKETIASSMLFFGIAAIGFTGSLVFYNSYLPEISTIDRQDAVSAKGYAYGYLGSVILQVICLILIIYPHQFGISDAAMASRISFLLTGVWWVGFAQIPFEKLPKGSPNYQSSTKSNGFKELSKVFKQVKQMPVLKTFLGGYFFLIMGVNTVMLVAALFGAKELKLSADRLILTILIIQIIAIFGARIMAQLSAKFGNIRILVLVGIIWIVVCITSYTVQTELGFYFLAILVGLVMGGSQSLSRSTYSKFLPENTADSASFFSFFDFTEKMAIVLGMALFATIDQLINLRTSGLSLIIPFGLGLLFLVKILIKYPTGDKRYKIENPT